MLDTTTTRAGTVREVLTELQGEIPGVITRYTECVATTGEYPKPIDLPCHPTAGSRDLQPAYGFLNLLVYVASGEADAATAANGECGTALTASNGETLSGWALQETIESLNDAFVVGYPDITARLQAVTDSLNGKAAAVDAVLAVC